MKSFFFIKYESLSLLASALVMSSLLLVFRIKLNKSFFYLFLVWNVILAIIPYAITLYLSATKLTKFKLGFWFCVWLLFLPNAPYILTDLLHLRVSNTHFMWLDILVILSFAATGILLFYLSLNDMKNLLKQYFKKAYIKKSITLIIFLSSFGVYLGRFLRYNSWEILSQPQNLFSDVLNMVLHPFKNSEVWLFTFGFGLFLLVGYWMFNRLYSSPST